MRNNEEDGRRQDELSKWLRVEPKSVIAGDFNLHSEVWSRLGRRDEEADELVEWCDTNDFVILNSGVDTRVDRNSGTGGAPDITIVHSSLVERCSWKVAKGMGSDHNLIITTIISCKREGRQESTRYTWQWRKADWEKFGKKVEENLNGEREQDRKLNKRIKDFNQMVTKAAKERHPEKESQSDLTGWKT